MNQEINFYIERLKVEFNNIFENGNVVAHIVVEPPVLTMDGKDDTSLVACDLWCADPSAGYDISILIDEKPDFSKLDTPVVTTLDEAKSLAIIIGQQVSSYQISE